MNTSELLPTPPPMDSGPEISIRLKDSCALSSLSSSEQEQLFDWLELYPAKEVLDKIAAPAPEGFAIKTHLTSLRRFHGRARARFHRQITAAPLELVAAQEPDARAADQLTASAQRQFAMEMATVQKRDPVRFGIVSRWVLRLEQNSHHERQLKIAEERVALMKARVALEKTKFEFNSARAALNYLPQLKAIVATNPGDNEDKIWAAREAVFGPLSDLIENPNIPKPTK